MKARMLGKSLSSPFLTLGIVLVTSCVVMSCEGGESVQAVGNGAKAVVVSEAQSQTTSKCDRFLYGTDLMSAVPDEVKNAAVSGIEELLSTESGPVYRLAGKQTEQDNSSRI